MSCINRSLYTCLNNSIDNSNKSVLILKARSNIWLPINVGRLCDDRPMVGFSVKLIKNLMKKSKQFV